MQLHLRQSENFAIFFILSILHQMRKAADNELPPASRDLFGHSAGMVLTSYIK